MLLCVVDDGCQISLQCGAIDFVSVEPKDINIIITGVIIKVGWRIGRPAESGKLTIKVTNMRLPATITLYNMLGQEIDTIRMTRESMVIDIARHGSVALVKVSDTIQVVSKRVIFK